MIGHHGFGFAKKYLPIKSIGIIIIFRLIRQDQVNVNTLKLKYKKVDAQCFIIPIQESNKIVYFNEDLM